MSGTRVERRAGTVRAAAKHEDELITRAAKRADWAGTALQSAAGDLDDVRVREGNDLTGLAEVVKDEAGRVSRIAQDIESRRAAPDEEQPNHEA